MYNRGVLSGGQSDAVENERSREGRFALRITRRSLVQEDTAANEAAIAFGVRRNDRIFNVMSPES